MPLTTYTAGEVLTAASLNANLVFAAANPTAPAQAIFNETQASGTAGGTFTAGSYLKRTLNTTVINNITGCSIAASVITLAAGTYQVFANCPAGGVDRHKIRLQNTTASTTLAIGQSQFANTAASVHNDSQVQTYFVLTVSSTIQLQHRAQTTVTTNGFGIPTSFGDSEIYSQITITKVA